ncbi:MAG: signal peptide peptidase SppA [Muribaculaceae bacterium]|nr:signal peptide peptidase SppA [Muribaculaceae bacterium]
MKKFFISFLGAMAGIWFSLFIITIGFFIVIIAAAASSGGGSKGTLEVKKGSYLTIDLSGSISDRPGKIDPMRFLQGDTDVPMGLNQIVGAIEDAAEDDRIEGIVYEAGGVNAGTAQIQAIQEALKRFREAAPQKWVYAYGDSYTLGDYYLASLADSIFLNPEGMIDIHGIGQMGMYFKNLLDKLGVEVQVVKVGTYKSAVEPFIRTEMSEPAREQAKLYVDNIWGYLAKSVADGRNVTVEDVNRWANSYLMTKAPTEYIKEKIADRLVYRHEFDERIMALTNTKKVDDLPAVSISEYVKGRDLLKKGSGKGAKIALLYACGDITDEDGDGIVGADMVPEILKLAEEDDIDGLVMYVNSGGGSAYASEQIWEALQQWKKKTGKPFYVSMSDYAASGGYYISCGADRIYAQPTTLTGSIGIFGMIPNIQPMLSDKLGVNTSVVRSCPDGQIPGILEPMSPGLRAAMQGYVERGYDLFTRRCAEGRGMSQDSIKAIAEGRVWDGAEALRIGLVDELGGLDAAIAGMAKKLNVETWTIKEYPSQDVKWYDAILMAGSELKASMVRSELGDMAPVYDNINRVKNMSAIQARMEFVGTVGF